MKKLLIALALVPALSQAALVVEGVAPTGAPPGAPKTVATSSAVATTDDKAPSAGPKGSGFVMSPLWEMTPADETFQKLFARWSQQAGWKSFWEVDQDIPVIASWVVSGSFTDVVQSVLEATLSTDLPAHPCFYSNNVVRVLPTSTECDPK